MTTCDNRFVGWRKAGVWDRFLAAVSAAFQGKIVMIDFTCSAFTSSVLRGKWGGENAARDVAGVTSRANPLADADGRPIALRLTGYQVHDSQEAQSMLEAVPEGATQRTRQQHHPRNCRRKERVGQHPIPPTAGNGSPSRIGFIGRATWSNASDKSRS